LQVVQKYQSERPASTTSGRRRKANIGIEIRPQRRPARSQSPVTRVTCSWRISWCRAISQSRKMGGVLRYEWQAVRIAQLVRAEGRALQHLLTTRTPTTPPGSSVAVAYVQYAWRFHPCEIKDGKLVALDAAQRKAQPLEPLVDDYETDGEFYE